MEEDVMFSMRQLNCAHQTQRSYHQRRYDILNGYEFNLTRCINCHKIMELEAKKFSK